MSHEGTARVWHFQPRVVLFPCPTNDCVSYVLLYGQLHESWITSGLQWQNVHEYRLPSKNAHSPNCCSWLAVCVNYSANFYCKIALTDKTVFTSTIAYNFIQIGLGVSVLRMRDFAPLGTKWLGYFWWGGVLEKGYRRRAHRFWRKIRQTTRFRVRNCLLGSETNT